jgi:uncharacterized protein (TIGR04141 family)
MFDAFTTYVGVQELDAVHATLTVIDVAGEPAILIGVQGEESACDWCPDAATTTGLDMPYTDSRAGAVLFLAVDGVVYAMTYGSGHTLVPDELKDSRFGLSFTSRGVNPDQLQDLVRRRMNARGRTDITMVPAGAPVRRLEVAEHVEVIRRVGGRAEDLRVTFASRDDRPVNVQGSVGLRMRFGVSPADLVRDIREVARVCRDEEPHRDLAFIDYIQPVEDGPTKADLDRAFDDLLGRAEAADHVAPVVPLSALDDFPDARSFTVRIGGAQPITYPSLDVDTLLRRARLQRPGDRVAKLRTGSVAMNNDDDGRLVLVTARADKWLEVSLSLGTRQFFTMEGDWYEIGEAYVRAARAAITSLFAAAPSVNLPPWYLTKGHGERQYNEYVPRVRPGFICLDRDQGVRNPIEPRHNTVEICDLLGPDNELILAKRAEGSAPLSHLFYQGLVAVQTFISGPSEVRDQFRKTVANLGRELPADFRPAKVVFAIMLGSGKQLTADTLFAFSQVTLAHAARVLRGYGIDVEVIGIPAA